MEYECTYEYTLRSSMKIRAVKVIVTKLRNAYLNMAIDMIIMTDA